MNEQRHSTPKLKKNIPIVDSVISPRRSPFDHGGNELDNTMTIHLGRTYIEYEMVFKREREMSYGYNPRFMPGPVFFNQERVGANNIKFRLYKFRSMTVQGKEKSDVVWTTANDSRVTWIGKTLRKTNLDELPQFWNVLIGDMSVVGPRPEREHFVEQFKKDISQYKVRHLAKSGITGWAQVNGWRGDTSIEKRVDHDIYYIENWSFSFDLRIIWRTVFGRETNKNAY